MAHRWAEWQASDFWLCVPGALLTGALFVSPALAMNASAGSSSLGSRPHDLEVVAPQAGVQVGSEAPDIALESIDGDSLRLSDLKGDKNIILVFFRGTW